MNSEIHMEHDAYRESLFTNRFIKHQILKSKIGHIQSQACFKVRQLGSSVQQREIYQLTIGTGKIQVMLWSQMHGDEPTGTLAFFDLFNFFAADDQHNAFRKRILDNCTLHFIPMLNPDGAEVHQRRNAQGIDINRDFLKQQSTEARLLAGLQQNIQPEFGFNMHDQDTLWSVSGSKKPATISLLAPPADDEASITPGRLKAMLLTAGIYQVFKKQIPGCIGRWSEEYEARAFGDNFQRLGTSTVLIEAGGYPGDFEKQYARKLTFDILLYALNQISTQQYAKQQLSQYHQIPFNHKELFHLLIKNCQINNDDSNFTADIGLNYTEIIDLEHHKHKKIYTVADFGDLSTWNAYDVFDADGWAMATSLSIGEKPTLKIVDTQGNILVMDQGVMV
ncbi:M14 family zinc carboxypeptidase [Mucilaginibacter paludis]|nr:M14 family zinc carboxypeptidase [Mucilaginibacter paludis]